MRLPIGFALVLAGLGGVTARADEPTAKCSLRVIQAQHEGAFVDPNIKMLRPYLEREPFDDWKHFTLVNSKEMLLLPKGSASEVLPNGRKATITYVEHLLGADKKHRVRLRLKIEKGDKQELDMAFALDEGTPFLHALQRSKTAATEMLILGISCELPH